MNPLDGIETPELPFSGSAGKGRRLVAKIRTFNGKTKKFEAWTSIIIDKNSEWKYNLKRGGKLAFMSNIISDSVCKNIEDEIIQKSKNMFRQYKSRNYDEPRLHFLLCSNANEISEKAISPTTTDSNFENKSNKDVNHFQPGYKYHSVNMKGTSLYSFPLLDNLAADMAEKNGIKKESWNVGVHIVLYRNGSDRIGWHADDTQGEKNILSLIVSGVMDSPRVVKVRPKHLSKSPGDKFQDGDEEIQIFPGVGDAYEMDGQ